MCRQAKLNNFSPLCLYWQIIRAKSAEFRSAKEEEEDNFAGNVVSNNKNLVSELLKLSTGDDIYTNEAIREEIEGIIVVGNETTALTTAFVVLMLAMHEDIQDTVFREIERVFKNDTATYGDNLSELRYTEMVIKETLRLFPPGPLIVKRATENVQLSKCVCFVFLGVLHRLD